MGGSPSRARPRLILAAATWGGVGYLPGMPGTWGTLAALPLWWLLAQLGPWGYGLAVAALLGLALWAAGPAQEYLGRVDHPAIVVDEVVGLLITLAAVPLTWQNAATGFVIFRILDILKPFPIRWFGKGEGGLEVVADDVAAGVIGRLILEVICGGMG
ncbi:MAG: phosphatidylglycerophosphatase A [Deltaproteobacteria bacterium]|nr:phosphatidylglycerophosphatase A [Deltaproteobacteria bacterium]MBI4795344.1 phosphatidylglycerophosphatase A [Deltaproteobacteria bacterium]